MRKIIAIGAVGVAVYFYVKRGGGVSSVSGNVPTDDGSTTVLSEIYNMTKSLFGEPRGIRNNNPGNLEANGIKWQGLSKTQTDGRFYQFVEPFWGIRALARDMYTKIGRGVNTPKKIIEVYAPSFENNTTAYYESVADFMGIGVNDRIDSGDFGQMMLLVTSIIKHENGKQPYGAELIGDAVNAGSK